MDSACGSERFIRGEWDRVRNHPQAFLEQGGMWRDVKKPAEGCGQARNKTACYRPMTGLNGAGALSSSQQLVEGHRCTQEALTGN